MTSYGSPLFNMSDQYAEGRLEYMVCNSDRKDVSYVRKFESGGSHCK